MANENQVDFTVRVKNEGLGEVAGDLNKVEDATKDLGTAATAAGGGVDKLADAAGQAGAGLGSLADAQANAEQQAAGLGGSADDAAREVAEMGQTAAQTAQQTKEMGAGAEGASKSVKDVGKAADQAGSELDDLRKAVEAKTAAIKSGLQVEQSEIELQRQHLTLAQGEQQATLRAAQARGDESAATQAQNRLRQIESEQLALVGRAKRAEADAIQQATDARREEMAAVGPLTAAQNREIQAAENHAKALRVQAAAADQASQRALELGGSFDETSAKSAGLNTALTGVAKAVAGLFAVNQVAGYAKSTIEIADAYGQMAERIQMATGNTGEYDLVQRRLLESANLTYRALSEQQELYIQTADALRGMSYSTADVLDITDSFSYLLTTNAASVERGKNAIDAYTKSIQSGRVEVDSWQSIMAATPTVVDAIATATGKTSEEVRRLGITGKLSIADLNEGLRQTVNLNKEAAAGMSATVKDAVTRLTNTWTVYVGEANRANQATGKIVFLVDQLSANLETVASAAVVAGEVMVAVWAVKALNALKLYTAQLAVAAAETTALMAGTAAAGSKLAAGLAAAGKVAAAGWVGWEIGTFLKSEFEVVEKAGIALAAGATRAAAQYQAAWEMAKAVFTDDTIEAAQERLRQKLLEIDDAYANLFAEADRAAAKQLQTAQATAAAGQAAQNASVQWQNLRTDYAQVNKELEEQAALVQKTAILRNAEASAAVDLAKAFGTEREQREAQTAAAATQAEQLMALAAQRSVEVNVLKAEADALKAVGEALLKSDPEKKKQLADLEKQIALREADAGAAMAQARAGQVAAAQAAAEAEALKDNSGRVRELAEAYEQARAKLEQVRAAKAAGKATTEELTAAEIAAGRAAALYRDALQDQLQAIQAKANAQQSSIGLEQAGVRLAIEQQRAILEVARARGDERTAMQAQNEIRRLEIQLLELTAQAKRAEAQAALASIEVKRAELVATGQLTDAKRLELDAARNAARAKEVEAKISEVTAQKMRNLASAHADAARGARDNAQATNESADALERLNDATDRFKSRDTRFVGMLQSDINQMIAERYGEDMIGNAKAEEALNRNMELENDQKSYGDVRRSQESLNQERNIRAERDRLERELEEERKGKNASSTSTTAPAPSAQPAASGGRSGSGSSGASAPSYVSNITLTTGRTETVRYADAQSMSVNERLLRDLAEGKGVYQ